MDSRRGSYAPTRAEEASSPDAVVTAISGARAPMPATGSANADAPGPAAPRGSPADANAEVRNAARAARTNEIRFMMALLASALRGPRARGQTRTRPRACGPIPRL